MKNGKRMNILEGRSEAESVEFYKFKEVFENLVEQYNAAFVSNIIPESRTFENVPTLTKKNTQGERQPIQHLKGFYSTLLARILTIVFALFTIGIAYPLYLGYGSASSYFRFLVILIPGIGYMFYRTFIKKG